MEKLYEKMRAMNEFYVAELLVNPDRSPLYRYSKAVAEYLKNAPLTPYGGGKLYPSGKSMYVADEVSHIAVRPEYAFTTRADMNLLYKKDAEVAAFFEKEHFGRVAPINTPHTVGGAGYTHSFINFRRILKEGLSGYRQRVQALDESDFKDAMLFLLDGIEVYHKRCIAYLTEIQADPALIDALTRVPIKPVQNIYEALVAWNFVYYIDGCDDIGGLDRGLYPYWRTSAPSCAKCMKTLMQTTRGACRWALTPTN